MEEIFEDDNLFDAFYSYSQRNLMSETIDLWRAVEGLDELVFPDEKGRRFKEIAAEYFLRGCRSPVNLNHDLIDRLRHTHLDLQYGSILSPPSDLILDLRKEIWLLMSSSCLPAFLESDVFDSFQRGVMFSSKDEFSRYKAEQFFGHQINGPLQRSDVIEVYQRGLYRRPREAIGKLVGGRKKEPRMKPSQSGRIPLSSSNQSMSQQNPSSSSGNPPGGKGPHSLPSPSSSSASPAPVRPAARVDATDFSFLTDFSESTQTDRSEMKESGFLDYC